MKTILNGDLTVNNLFMIIGHRGGSPLLSVLIFFLPRRSIIPGQKHKQKMPLQTCFNLFGTL